MSATPPGSVNSAGQTTSFVKRALEMALTAKGFSAVAAVFGITVLIAAVSKLGLSWAVVALGVVLAIFLATIYVCFSWTANVGRKNRSFIGGMLAYTVVVVVCCAVVFAFLSAFFDWPLPFRKLIVAQLGTENNVRQISDEETRRALDNVRVISEHASKTAEEAMKKAEAASKGVGGVRVISQTKTRDTVAPASRTIREIIISETASPSRSSFKFVDYLKKELPGLGYHFLVDRQGLIYPMEDIAKVTGHTPGHNQTAIGIGLEHSAGEPFPETQLTGLEKLLANLAHRLNLPPTSIYSKEEIDPKKWRRDITSLMPQIRERVQKQLRG